MFEYHILGQPPSYYKTANWPVLEPGKSHIGRWLKQASHNRQYTENWLEQVEYLHQRKHQMAALMKQQSNEGQINAARLGFKGIETIVQQLDKLFKVRN